METVETPQTAQPTEQKSTDWTKIILAALVGFGLLVGSAYAGYWYGTQQVQPAEELTPAVSQPTTKPTPTPTPTPTQTVTDPTTDWKSCANPKLNVSIKYPSSWSCVVDTEPRTSNYNIELIRSDGKKVSFEDVYPFGPTDDISQVNKIEIAQIELNNKNFKINLYPTRTDLPPLLEQVVYDSENLRMFYIVSFDIKELTPEDKEELMLVFESIALLN